MSGNINFTTHCESIQANIAPLVQQSIIEELIEAYPNIEVLPIGSVGKRNENEFNGDIDIAVKCENVDVLHEIITNTFNYLDTVKIESLYIVSIAYPYKLNRDADIKYVQVDFMNIWDIEYTKFRYYCPDYRKQESVYKVGQKIMFANMILNHSPKQINCVYDFRPTALFRYEYNQNNTVVRFITLDPNKIANMCFYDGDKSHFNSIETLWEAIHSDIFKYPDEVKDIERNFFVNCWRKGWVNIVPENFKLQYWSNDEIWQFMNKQDSINKINHSIAKIVDMENK